MSIKRLFAIIFILCCTALAWALLGGAIALRSASSESQLTQAVLKNWGPALVQEPPTLFYEAPTSGRAQREIQPESSDIQVRLRYEPKQKGLLWYRTYFVEFEATYRIQNPTPVAQTLYAVFKFPASDARYDRFTLSLGEKLTDKVPSRGELRESHLIPPGGELPLKITYRAAGTNTWTYALQNAGRIKDLHLAMQTDFHQIDVPAGAESPTARKATEKGWELQWDYTGVLGANAIAMEMPSVTNPGAVARRMSFFAPISLLFFFAVLVIVSLRQRLDLHPMNYFFLAAGCFAFQLLFAYLVDLLPLHISFLIAAGVSMALVNVYLWRAAGARFARISMLAQFAYMVLFSYSFFFEGLTGISITVGAILTLALLMASTARLNWSEAFSGTARHAAPVPPVPPSRPPVA